MVVTNAKKINWMEWAGKIITIVLVLAIGGVGGYYFATSGTVLGIRMPFLEKFQAKDVYRLTYSGQPERYKDVDFDLFWGVWDLLDRRYYKPDSMNGEQMVDGAISGMVSALGDPYTMYIPPITNAISEGDLSGKFGGVGIELSYIEYPEGTWTVGVGAPLEGTPAERAGIRAGDVIIHVKDEKEEIDEDTYEWTITRAQQVLRGEIGTDVTLTIFRKDGGEEGKGESFDVAITREEIKVDSLKVIYEELADGRQVARIVLSRFTERSREEWNAAVNEIAVRKKNLAGVILDLRNNPGGYFSEAIHVASEFIEEGVVVTEKGKTVSNEYKARGGGKLYDVPLVVLVNGGSASSSEIVAGALHDHGRAKLVGSKTFGKGLIQERLELVNDAALNVTVAQWILPSGEWLDRNGIDPDIEVEQDYDTEADEVLDYALGMF